MTAGERDDTAMDQPPADAGDQLGDKPVYSVSADRRNSSRPRRHAADGQASLARLLALEADLVTSFIGRLKAEFGDDDVLVADMIEGSTSIHELLEAASLRVFALEANMHGIKDTIAKLRQRNSRFERQVNSLREGMRAAMSAAEQSTIELAAVTVCLASAPRRLAVIDPSVIPSEFWKHPLPELDKRALADALKCGKDIPGARLDNGGDIIKILSN